MNYFRYESINLRGGVRLSLLGTPITGRFTVPATDKDNGWMWSSQWNDNWQGKPKYSEKIYPIAILSATNPA
jgi:hypothetical protein